MWTFICITFVARKTLLPSVFQTEIVQIVILVRLRLTRLSMFSGIVPLCVSSPWILPFRLLMYLFHLRCWTKVSWTSPPGIKHCQPGRSLDVPKLSQGDKNQPSTLLDHRGRCAAGSHPGGTGSLYCQEIIPIFCVFAWRSSGAAPGRNRCQFCFHIFFHGKTSSSPPLFCAPPCKFKKQKK